MDSPFSSFPFAWMSAIQSIILSQLPSYLPLLPFWQECVPV